MPAAARARPRIVGKPRYGAGVLIYPLRAKVLYQSGAKWLLPARAGRPRGNHPERSPRYWGKVATPPRNPGTVPGRTGGKALRWGERTAEPRYTG